MGSRYAMENRENFVETQNRLNSLWAWWRGRYEKLLYHYKHGISLLLSILTNRSFAIYLGVVSRNNWHSVILKTVKCIIHSHRWQHVLQYALVSIPSDYSSLRKTRFFLYVFILSNVARTRLNPTSRPLL
jgi:hypothetical protein